VLNVKSRRLALAVLRAQLLGKNASVIGKKSLPPHLLGQTVTSNPRQHLPNGGCQIASLGVNENVTHACLLQSCARC
jgi:hypothetical protein